MKLNKPTYLLICLIEECAEVIHRACKAIRFGSDAIQPGQGKTNSFRLREELSDLTAVCEMCEDENAVECIPGGFSKQQIENKQSKLQKYIDYSRDLGTLD